jgi:hypothetical protein
MPWSEHLQILSSNPYLCMRPRRRSIGKKIPILPRLLRLLRLIRSAQRLGENRRSNQAHTKSQKPQRTTAPCVVCPRLLRHHDPHCPSSIAKSTTLLFHELSRARALKAFGDHLEFDVAGVRHLARSFLCDFGVVIPSQPRCQFTLVSFAVRDAESSREGRPPIWNAFVADEQIVVEERTRFRGAEKLPALGAALHAKQSQGPNQIVEIVLNP